MRALVVIAILLAGPAAAQSRVETLADIRQQLSVLYVEIQKLKVELSTTGGVSQNLAGTNTLERVDSIEAELRRLIAANEALTNRVNQVVVDGTKRVGDLEFRLCELEKGCDVSKLGDTPTLGGGKLPAATAMLAPAQPVAPTTADAASSGGAELAVAEKDDFDRAKAAYDAGNYQTAADQFAKFTDTYQGSPLSGLAHLLRGESLMALGQTASAARAYLDSYSGAPDGPTSPTALLKLGLALDGLGQGQEACITLGEVTSRFPASDASTEAKAARADMGCS